MPIRLDIKKKLTAPSERVKSVDMHPVESWALAALYSGNVLIWDYETSTCVKSFELSTLPVRCAKFVVRKQWFVAASDDMRIRIFNYNTMEKMKEMEGHSDYIRYIEVHPTLPYFLSCSDDMTIKLWDWDRGCDCVSLFEGHAHYVMMCKFNPKDTNTFASASLDRTVKVWGLGSPLPHYTLEGHERGVNCVDYYPSGDKPYILSGADDRTVKVWDYQTKSIVHTLDGHSHNVCSVLFHPKLPLIASASEDGTVRLWQSSTYRAETTLNYGFERAWALAATKETNKLAIGFDEGLVVIELGSDDPVASMDATAKLVYAKNNEIFTANLRGLAGSGEDEVPEGERLPVLPRDLGSCELYPQLLKHNCNGRFIAVAGDGEFIIYTAQALRNKAFGQALDFVWSAKETGDYAIRESISRIKIFKNFKEGTVIKPAAASVENLFGGHLIGCKAADSAVLFYDWDTGSLVRKIDVCPKEIYWSDSGNMVLIATEEQAYVLTHNQSITATAIAMGNITEDGIDGSFDLLYEIQDNVTSGKWVGDCFLFCNNNGRLNYTVGGQVHTLQHLPTSSTGQTMHRILGYLPKENRVYLIDKVLNVITYKIYLAVLQYQTAVMRGDFDTANNMLPSIPESEYTTVAKFLESQGFKEEAMAVTTDPDHKFDLAIELNHIDVAHELILETPVEDKGSVDTMGKWKRLSDVALREGNFDLTEAASLASDDFSGLLLLYSATGNFRGVEKLTERANKAGKTNIAFVANLLTGNVEACYSLLLQTNRLPEAAFFARTYLPSKVDETVTLWKNDLSTVSESAANALACPSQNKNLFEDFDIALQVENMFLQQRAAQQGKGLSAKDYLAAKGDLDLNLIQLIKERTGMVAPPNPAEDTAEDTAENTAEDTAENTAENTAEDTAALEEAKLKEEQERIAAEQAAAAAAEEKRLAAEAEAMRLEEEAAARAAAEAEAKKDDMDDFGDDW